MSLWTSLTDWSGLVDHGIYNFGIVRSGAVYRGGQPSRDGWKYLKQLGVRSIVKLNYPDEGGDDHPGFQVFNCAMPPKDFWQSIADKPDVGTVQKAVEYLCHEALWPIYVHCLHGQDRTGLVVGEFRVMHDAWSVDRAYAEMMRFGFHPELLDLLLTWKTFARQWEVVAP